MPALGQAKAFEKHPLEDQDEVGEGVDLGQQLEQGRHILHRRDIAGEDDGGLLGSQYKEVGEEGTVGALLGLASTGIVESDAR